MSMYIYIVYKHAYLFSLIPSSFFPLYQIITYTSYTLYTSYITIWYSLLCPRKPVHMGYDSYKKVYNNIYTRQGTDIVTVHHHPPPTPL